MYCASSVRRSVQAFATGITGDGRRSEQAAEINELGASLSTAIKSIFFIRLVRQAWSGQMRFLRALGVRRYGQVDKTRIANA